jgi:hypothetical protein
VAECGGGEGRDNINDHNLVIENHENLIYIKGAILHEHLNRRKVSLLAACFDAQTVMRAGGGNNIVFANQAQERPVREHHTNSIRARRRGQATCDRSLAAFVYAKLKGVQIVSHSNFPELST